MKPLPFKMRQETEMEKYRAATWDTKEPETIEWIRSFEPNSVFFDVGANVGVYSLYAASLYPEMRILSFEPMPENAFALRANKNMNDFKRIVIVAAAVSDAIGNAYFDSFGLEAGQSGGQLVGGNTTIPIEVTTVDFIAKELFKPDYVKIDIDGQELAVIHGMKKTLPHVKSILVEVSKASKQPIMDILTAAGFTTDNRFNTMTPHSRERREREGIDAENIIFTR